MGTTTAHGQQSIRVTTSNSYLADDYEFRGVESIDVAMPNDLTDAFWIRWKIAGGDWIERYITAGHGYIIPCSKGSIVLFNVKAAAATTPDADIWTS